MEQIFKITAKRTRKKLKNGALTLPASLDDNSVAKDCREGSWETSSSLL